MPTLFARRYMRKIEAVGSTEKVLGVLILLLVVTVIAAFVLHVATNKDYLFDVDENAYLPMATPEVAGAETARGVAVEAADRFPDPGVDGWLGPTRVEHFAAGKLYEKIDGRADAFLRFGVVALSFATYVHQTDADRAVDVYWYDMGKPQNAVGMYRSEQAPDAAPVSIGRVGYQVGGAVFFCQGSSYVQVIPTRLDDADAQAALKIAERVAERIKGNG